MECVQPNTIKGLPGYSTILLIYCKNSIFFIAVSFPAVKR